MDDKSLMPFGKHKGKTLEDTPAGWLVWFMEQDWAEEKYPELFAYCEEKEEQLRDEAKEYRPDFDSPIDRDGLKDE